MNPLCARDHQAGLQDPEQSPVHLLRSLPASAISQAALGRQGGKSLG